MLGRATFAGTTLAVLAHLAGCELVSGLNDIMIPEPPESTGETGTDAAWRDVEGRDESDDASDTRTNDVGPSDASASDVGPSDTRASDVGPSDARASDVGPSDASASDVGADATDGARLDDASFDASDGPCSIGHGAAHDETMSLQGTFQMGADGDAGSDFANAVPRHPATLGPFAIDKTEVTVARFRLFVNDYSCWRRTHPADNEGAIGGAAGRGWQSSWTSRLVSETELRAKLACDGEAGSLRATWTNAPDASSENRPIDCVTWYEALAFCIWDGGRLPTETEWEFTAAGGTAGRPYPTGFTAPFPMAANYDSPAGGPVAVDGAPMLLETFATRFLAGNVAEWVFDGQGPYKASCSSTADCTTVPGDADARGVRGGSWSDPALEIRSARRTFRAPADRSTRVGLRCARDKTSTP